VVFSLHREDYERRAGNGATHQPPLGDHRRNGESGRGHWPRGGWQSAGLGTGAEFRVHLGMPAHDSIWVHAWDVSDGQAGPVDEAGRGCAVRYRDRAVYADGALHHGELEATVN